MGVDVRAHILWFGRPVPSPFYALEKATLAKLGIPRHPIARVLSMTSREGSTRERDKSYDWACFQFLAYEFDGYDPTEAEKKIRRKLKRDKLGPYIQERIDLFPAR